MASYVDDALFGGPGVALLRGMSDDPLWTDEPSALLSFAKRIGSLLPQNEAGDLVDQVTFTSGSHVRGAKTRRELPFHTDLGPCVPDVFLLYCVHQAPRGGGTIVVDGLRVPEWLDDEALTVLTSPFPFDVSDNAVDSS
ncbi:TauD/TfdA family dioxygenase, partial [Kibdelosporangium lantanae]